MTTNIATLVRDLDLAKNKLADLQARRDRLARQHVDAISSRRALLLDADPDDKMLAKVDQTASQCERQLTALDDALASQRDRVNMLTATVTAQREQETREAKAKAIENMVPPLHASVAAIAPAIDKLVALLRTTEIPEAVGAATLLADSWSQVTREIELKIVGELQANARAARIPPPPPQPQPKIGSQLLPQPYRVGDVPDHRFADWDSPEAAHR